jgi:hypothetical protein
VKRVALLLLVGVVAAACGGNGDEEPRLADEQPEETTTTTEPEPEEFIVGDRVVIEPGIEATLYAYEQPVPPAREFEDPAPGQEFAVADYEVCTTDEADPGSGGVVIEVGVIDLALVLAEGNVRIQPSVWDARGPAFPEIAGLFEDECVRGWATFEIPVGQRPVAFRAGGEQRIEWMIP